MLKSAAARGTLPMRKSFLTAAAMLVLSTAAQAQPEARFETSLGNFTVLLEDAKAPITVKHFIALVKKGVYNNTQIYRIVPDFVVQTGSMGADGKWRPLGKPVALETNTGLSNTRGTLSLARDEKPATGNAEFFINLSDSNAKALDAKPEAAPNTTGYAVFGHISSGMEVIEAMAAEPIGGGQGPFPLNYPVKKIVIKKVTIGQADPPPPAPAEPAAPAEPTPPATPPSQ